MKSLLVVTLLATACFAAPADYTAAATNVAVNKDLVFRCLPSADLHVLKDKSRPLYICRAEGRVLALVFDSLIPNNDKELHVVLDPETLRKLGEAVVPREARYTPILGSGSSSMATAQSGMVGIGIPLLGPVSVSGSIAHAQSSSSSGGIGGILPV